MYVLVDGMFILTRGGALCCAISVIMLVLVVNAVAAMPSLAQ